MQLLFKCAAVFPIQFYIARDNMYVRCLNSPVILPIFPSNKVPTKPATCAPRLTPMKWKDSSVQP